MAKFYPNAWMVSLFYDALSNEACLLAKKKTETLKQPRKETKMMCIVAAKWSDKWKTKQSHVYVNKSFL